MSQDKNFLLVVQIKDKKKREKPQGLNANFLPRGQRRLQITIVRQFRVILQEESKKKKKKKKKIRERRNQNQNSKSTNQNSEKIKGTRKYYRTLRIFQTLSREKI